MTTNAEMRAAITPDLPELRDYIRGRRAALAGFMEQAARLALERDTLIVKARNPSYVRYLTENRNSIAQLASELYKRPLRVEVKLEAVVNAGKPARHEVKSLSSESRSSVKCDGSAKAPKDPPESDKAKAPPSLKGTDRYGADCDGRDSRPPATHSIGSNNDAGPRANLSTSSEEHLPLKVSCALAYARHGMLVFPVHCIEADGECSCGKLHCSSAGKHPRLSQWQTLATVDERQIRDWWQQYPDANIGVKCGADSNLTVLDVDGDAGRDMLRELELENGELPETPIAITGSGGVHYYFAYELGLQNAVRFAPGLDIRTEGGLVVGVGSKNKRTYEWEAFFTLGVNDLRPARMPRWLVERIKAKNGTAHRAEDRATLPTLISEGQRNSTLYSLGRSLKLRGLGQAAILAALQETNHERCRPELSPEELKTLVEHLYRQPDRPNFHNGTQTLLVNANRAAETSFDMPEVFARKQVEFLGWKQLQERRRTNVREWVVDGWLARRETSLWSGKVEAGKTTLMRELAMCVLRGEPFLGQPTVKGRVFYAMLDADGEDVTYDEFEKLGLNDSDIENIQFMFEPMLAQMAHGVEQFFKRLWDWRPSLVIIDPFARLKEVADFTDYNNTYLMGMLSEYAKRINAHLALPGHIPRGRHDDDEVATAGFGSISFSAGVNARFVVALKRNTNNIHTLKSSKGKGAGFQPLSGEQVLERNDITGRISLGGTFGFKEQARELKTKVLHFLEEHGGREFTALELARELNVQRSVVQTAANMAFGDQSIKREGEGIKSDPFRYRALVTK